MKRISLVYSSCVQWCVTFLTVCDDYIFTRKYFWVLCICIYVYNISLSLSLSISLSHTPCPHLVLMSASSDLIISGQWRIQLCAKVCQGCFVDFFFYVKIRFFYFFFFSPQSKMSFVCIFQMTFSFYLLCLTYLKNIKPIYFSFIFFFFFFPFV